MAERRKPARWRRNGGRLGEPVSYSLYRDNVYLASVQSKKVQIGHTAHVRWYWHLAGRWGENVNRELFESADEAKAAALKAVQKAEASA